MFQLLHILLNFFFMLCGLVWGVVIAVFTVIRVLLFNAFGFILMGSLVVAAFYYGWI